MKAPASAAAPLRSLPVATGSPRIQRLLLLNGLTLLALLERLLLGDEASTAEEGLFLVVACAISSLATAADLLGCRLGRGGLPLALACLAVYATQLFVLLSSRLTRPLSLLLLLWLLLLLLVVVVAVVVVVVVVVVVFVVVLLSSRLTRQTEGGAVCIYIYIYVYVYIYIYIYIHIHTYTHI